MAKKTTEIKNEGQEQEIVPEPSVAWITYSETCIGGEAEDPTDRWTSHADAYREVIFEGLYKNKPEHRFFCHSKEIDPALLDLDTVYMVVARYYDGDTFGRTYGHWHIYSFRATEEEARKDEEEIRNSVNEENTYKNYRPWLGYFSGLEDVEIHCMPFEEKDFVEDNKRSKIIHHQK